jgi:guanylate kinase
MIPNSLIIFSGPSGSGKTTIAKEILKQYAVLSFSVSATTRQQRINEINGQDYYFLTVDEFKAKIEKDEFIEFEEVYKDIFYGTLKTEMQRIWAELHIPLLDIDVFGALNIEKIYGKKALTLFIHPGSIENLRQRLIDRKSESPEALAKRLGKAETELAVANKFDFIGYNDCELESAVKRVSEIVSEFLSIDSL